MNTKNAVTTAAASAAAGAVSSSSATSSICNASHGSYGLPQPKRPVQPAIELVHRSSGSGGGGHRTNGGHPESILPSVLRKNSSTLSSHPKLLPTNPTFPSTHNNNNNNKKSNAPNTTSTIGVSKSRKDTDTVATPSSVHLIRASSTASKPYALSRDLSDLSGSYYNGTSGRSTTIVSTTTTTNTQNQNHNNTLINETTPWRHAKVLSRQRLPQHPQPYNMDDESSYGASNHHKNRQNIRNRNKKSPSTLSHGSGNHHHHHNPTSISMERGGDVIEVCLPNISFVAANTNNDTMDHHHATPSRQKVNRIPLLLILMDPQRKLYELLQLWIDTSIDTVRDILQTINKNIADHHHHHAAASAGTSFGYWKQDYDGLFQIRNNHFSQLIHVLPAGKYDIVPGEVWICKPWSMTSKQTVNHASTLLNHLKQLQILQYRKCSDYGPIWNQWKLFRSNSNTHTTSSSNNSHATNGNNNNNNSTNKLDDTVLVLSKKATQRLYVPGGILKHHHACQFLSFVPPLEPVQDNNVMVVIGPKTTTTSTTTISNDCSQSTASGLSDSNCDDDDDDDDDDVDHIIELMEDTDDDREQMLLLEDDLDDVDMKHIAMNLNDAMEDKIRNGSQLVHPTFSTTDDEDVGTQLPLLPLHRVLKDDDEEEEVDHLRRYSNATVCSTKTKESTYIFRTYTYNENADHHVRNKSIWKNTSNNHHISSSSGATPHVLPRPGSFGTFNDRTTSSSSLQRLLRRFYTLFQCRQQSMLNRRSRSYDEQLYYTNSSNNTGLSHQHQKYTNRKQRKSSGTTARTTVLSDDASILTSNNHAFHSNHNNNDPTNGNNQKQQQQWRDIDTASHCSGVPLLLTSAPTADWITHI